MERQNHIFDELTMVFSQERLEGYMSHASCNNNKDEALIAYSWNIELSQAFYPALQIFEIALRNSLHMSIAQHFQTEKWFELPFLHQIEEMKINKAKEKIKDRKKMLTSGRIVAELSFGFWVSLFDMRYEHGQALWPGLIKSAFPYLPKGQRTRHFLSRELNRIKFLRNRIFHYEPIWHWKDLQQQHDNIAYLTRCLSPVAAQYLQTMGDFKKMYAKSYPRFIL